MTQYFRKVECAKRRPEKDAYYMTNEGRLYFKNYSRLPQWLYPVSSHLAYPEWWFEPVKEPLYTKSEMLSCWDAALSHALKLKGYYKTFSGFIKSLKK